MTEDELRDLEARRLRSLVDADIATARELHADDYELVTPGGGTLSKGDYLDSIDSGAIHYLVFEADSEVRVRIQPTSGVVRYVARIEIEVEDERYSGRYWHTDLWEERDGRWQAAWSHATRIPEAED